MLAWVHTDVPFLFAVAVSEEAAKSSCNAMRPHRPNSARLAVDPRRVFATMITLALACGASVGAAPVVARRAVDCSRIMPLGDSITFGVNVGYRNRL